jgi:acetyl-CoA acetyltransferase
VHHLCSRTHVCFLYIIKGVLTAGNASQVSDGSAALLIVNEAGLKKLGYPQPLAVIRSIALAGTDPVLMLSGPIPATERVLKNAGLKVEDIDL